MRKIIFPLLFIFSFGCKCPQPLTNESNVVLKDSVSQRIIAPSVNSLALRSPCDSVGNVNIIYYNIKTPTGSLTIQNKGKDVLEVIQTNDSIVSTDKSHIKLVDKLVKIETKVTPKWVWYSLGLNLLVGVWSFRKFIPILKWF